MKLDRETEREREREREREKERERDGEMTMIINYWKMMSCNCKKIAFTRKKFADKR